MKKKDVKKIIDDLSEKIGIDPLKDNEAGELQGGFSELQSGGDAEIAGVNIFKCHCPPKETAS